MSPSFTRREMFGAFGAALCAPYVGSTIRAADHAPMSGTFMILSTPYTESNEVHHEDLAAQIDFVDLCGVDGLVWPQNSSEQRYLSKDERLRGMETIAAAARGRRQALVFGVQADDTEGMLEYAPPRGIAEPRWHDRDSPDDRHLAGRFPGVLRRAGGGHIAPDLHPDERRGAGCGPDGRLHGATGEGLPQPGLHQGRAGAGARADAGPGGAPAGSGQAHLRCRFRARLALRDADGHGRSDDRRGHVCRCLRPVVGVAPGRQDRPAYATCTASCC